MRTAAGQYTRAGAGTRVESMPESLRHARTLRALLGARMRRGEAVDGFGQPLYREGDPRARLLLDLRGERYATSAEYRFVCWFSVKMECGGFPLMMSESWLH